MTFGDRYKIKIGYAPTRRDLFSREDALHYKNMIEAKLKSWNIDLVDLDGINEEALLFRNEDIPAIVRKFKEMDVEAIFSPHCNFGTEDAVAKLAKAMGKPFLLWGPRDEAPLENGFRLRDSQCGLFATSKILNRLNVPFTYIVNSRLDSTIFESGFKNFIRVASIVKSFRNLRIGQISTRPEGFWSMIVNEGELLERFGIEICPVTLSQIVRMTKLKLQTNSNMIKDMIEDYKKIIDCRAIDDDHMEKIAALKLAILEWVKESGCNSIAIQCWSDLQVELGIVPCFVNSELTDMGIPIACETDIHGAITASMVQAAVMGESPVFIADFTIRHPEDENSELLWHCGSFPLSLKREGSKAKISNHYILKSENPGVCEWEIRQGDISLARFDGGNGKYSLLIGEGKGTEGPMTRGTYVWIKVNNWPKWEEKIIRGPYIHHIIGVHGKISTALREACRYIPDLTADEIEKSEEICYI